MSRTGAAYRFAGASVAIGACNIGVCAAGRWLNERLAEEVLWSIAQYRLAAVVLGLGLMNLLVAVCLWRAAFRGRLGRSAVVALILTLALGLELGMGIQYRRATGELRVCELFFTRAAINLASPAERDCVELDLQTSFRWRFGRQQLWPRLLPLPLDDAQLRAELESIACRS